MGERQFFYRFTGIFPRRAQINDKKRDRGTFYPVLKCKSNKNFNSGLSAFYFPFEIYRHNLL